MLSILVHQYGVGVYAVKVWLNLVEAFGLEKWFYPKWDQNPWKCQVCAIDESTHIPQQKLPLRPIEPWSLTQMHLWKRKSIFDRGKRTSFLPLLHWFRPSSPSNFCIIQAYSKVIASSLLNQHIYKFDATHPGQSFPSHYPPTKSVSTSSIGLLQLVIWWVEGTGHSTTSS